MTFDVNQLKVVEFTSRKELHIREAPGRCRETYRAGSTFFAIEWKNCYFHYCYLSQEQAEKVKINLMFGVDPNTMFAFNFHDHPSAIAPRKGPPVVPLPVRSKFF